MEIHMKTQNIALFDLDGTLADFNSQMKKDLRNIQTLDEPEFALHDHTAPKYFGARLDLIKSQPGWWLNLPKLVIGFDILHLAQKMGFQVEILTMGPHNTPAAWAEKEKWCHKNIGKSVRVTVTEDKSLVYGKVLVDDSPQFLIDWLERHPHGLGIAPAQPNNKSFSHPKVVRYNGTNLDQVQRAMNKVIDT